MSVSFGYAHRAAASPCFYCGYQYYAFEDDGNPETVKVLCWCGATARLRRDDPDFNVVMNTDGGT